MFSFIHYRDSGSVRHTKLSKKVDSKPKDVRMEITPVLVVERYHKGR